MRRRTRNTPLIDCRWPESGCRGGKVSFWGPLFCEVARRHRDCGVYYTMSLSTTEKYNDNPNDRLQPLAAVDVTIILY